MGKLQDGQTWAYMMYPADWLTDRYVPGDVKAFRKHYTLTCLTAVNLEATHVSHWHWALSNS